MPTNLAIDDDLLAKAQQVGKNKTKKDTVNQALREYIQRREQRKVLELFNTILYEPDAVPGARRRRD
jgi:Arc/MetJ family transcription regulator